MQVIKNLIQHIVLHAIVNIIKAYKSNKTMVDNHRGQVKRNILYQESLLADFREGKETF